MMAGYMGGFEAGCTSLPSVYVTLSKLPPPEKNCAWMDARGSANRRDESGRVLVCGGGGGSALSKLECTYLRWSDWRITWCTAIFFFVRFKMYVCVPSGCWSVTKPNFFQTMCIPSTRVVMSLGAD